MMPKLLAAAAAACLLAPAAFAADTIVTGGSGQRGLSLSSYDPLGQSFTATDPGLRSFGFQFNTLNAGSANTPVTLTLRAGDGFDGAIVAQVTQTLSGIPASRTPTWFDFDLTGTTLTAGQQYSALLTTSSNRYGLIFGPDINLSTGVALGGDAYVGGRFLATGQNDATCNRGICDANFRFSTIAAAAAVPEPATWGMAILGFGVIGASQRRRRRQPALA